MTSPPNTGPMAGAAQVTRLTRPSIMPRLSNGAFSRMMLVSNGSETPVPNAMMSRAVSNMGKFTASAPTTGPNCAARESSSGVLVSRFSM